MTSPENAPLDQRSVAGRQFSNAYGTLLHHQRICQAVCLLMEKNLKTPPSVTRLAAEVRLSPNYLCEIFHKTMGVTLGQYFNALRARKAQEFLLEVSANIKEVATRVGFSDANHFRVVFKKHTGMSPKEWRARMDEKALLTAAPAVRNSEPRDNKCPARSSSKKRSRCRRRMRK